eukprot:SAG31_NODE_41492_length_276_cov_0.559322_1_plen_37_part_10
MRKGMQVSDGTSILVYGIPSIWPSLHLSIFGRHIFPK